MKLRKNFFRTPIGITFAALAVLVLVLSGCTSGVGPSAGVDDGRIELEGATLDFGANSISDSSESTLTVIKSKKGEEPEGLVSTLFELYLDLTCDQPVTISIPFQETGEGGEEAQVVIGLGSKAVLADGRTEVFYSYVEAGVAEGIATATFIPVEYLEQLSVNGANGSAKPSQERLQLGVFCVNTAFVDGGHFVVYYYPLGKPFILQSSSDRKSLLSALEDVYNDYLGKGYTYDKREKWPMEVHIQSLDEDGYYSYGSLGAAGKIYLNRSLFEGGFRPDAIKPLLAHEFFHFVQFNYVTTSSDLLWFDEATATYFEGEAAGKIPSIVEAYKERVFSGVFPAENNAADGYARMPLIKFLAKKRGEKFTLNAYTIAGGGAAWDEALLSSTGPASVWAGDFYEALVKGEVSSYSPSTLHSNLAKGKVKGIGTALALKIPAADDITVKKDKGEEPVFGTTTVNIDPYGAQLVALTVDEKDLKKFDDELEPVVSAPGADVRVFAIKSKNVEVLSGGSGLVALNNFKKQVQEKNLFLVLVTGLHDEGKKDYTVTVSLPAYPTLDELVGKYPGSSLQIAEVNIPDALMAKAMESDDAGGCDAQMLAVAKGLEGQELPMTMEINKTGEKNGTLVLITEESETTEAGKTFLEPFDFVYNENDGKLTINATIDNDSIKGLLIASYGEKNKDVLLGGDMELGDVNSSDGIGILMRLKGSKPLAAK
ncbi:MAG: hypothetical protein GX989_03310 [Firmicutes bacterium]|nr:hypothetical protein [Bacillota bacterium]